MSSLGYLFCLPFSGLHLLCLPGSNASGTKTKKSFGTGVYSLQLFSLYPPHESEAIPDRLSVPTGVYC